MLSAFCLSFIFLTRYYIEEARKEGTTSHTSARINNKTLLDVDDKRRKKMEKKKTYRKLNDYDRLPAHYGNQLQRPTFSVINMMTRDKKLL